MSFWQDSTPVIKESKMMDNARTKNRSCDKELTKKLDELDKQYQLKKSKLNVDQVFLQQAADDYRFNRRPTIVPRGLTFHEREQFLSLRRASEPIIPDVDTWLALSKARREPIRIPRLRKRGRSLPVNEKLPPVIEGPLVGQKLKTKPQINGHDSKNGEETKQKGFVPVNRDEQMPREVLETESEPEMTRREEVKMRRSLTFANILTEHEKGRLLTRRSNYAHNYHYLTPRGQSINKNHYQL